MTRFAAFKKTFSIIGILLLSLLLFLPAAQAAESVVPHQVLIKDGIITSYFDILDHNGKSVLHVAPDQVKLTFDNQQVKVQQFSPFANRGEGVAAVLMIDLSLSLGEDNFQMAKQALDIWVDSMTASDRTALVAFTDKVTVYSEFTNDRTFLKSQINELRLAPGGTQLNDAMIEAYKIAGIIDDSLPARRVVVALSDGIHQAPTGATRDEIIKKIQEVQIPFYSIAYSNKPSNSYERAAVEGGQEALSTFSRLSGGGYYPTEKNSLAAAYAGINARIRNSYVVVGDISNIKGDGKLHRVQIDYASANGTLSEGMDVRYAASQSKQSKLAPKVMIGAGVLVLIALACAFMASKKKKNAAKKVEAPAAPVATAKAPSTKPMESPATAGAQAASPKTNVNIPTKPAGIEIVLTPLGTAGAKPYQVKIQDRVEIGRSKNAQVSLPDDAAISSRHCEISWSGGVLYLKDLGSTNGTNVNGIPITSAYRLKPGDVIGIGQVQLRLGDIREL